jgi:hypothetical protein
MYTKLPVRNLKGRRQHTVCVYLLKDSYVISITEAAIDIKTKSMETKYYWLQVVSHRPFQC